MTNLQPGETVQLVMRRHWFVLVHTFAYIAFLVVSALAVFLARNSISALIPVELTEILVIIYISVFSLFIYADWIANELDFFIFTNKRIIGIEQVSFLNREVSECSLDRVQEVNAFAKGLLANLFNFGTVTIHTASEQSEFEMHTIAAPLEQARHIQNIVQENKTTLAASAKGADTHSL